jgi:uncharacterized Rmd1/YagE family protein
VAAASEVGGRLANTSIATAGRGLVLTRKLTVISDSAKAFADIIDTERSARLELIIVALISWKS